MKRQSGRSAAKTAGGGNLDLYFTVALDWVCLAGLDGYFKRVNPAMESALGFSSSELRAKPFLEFIHPDDRDQTLTQIEHVTTGGDTVNFECRFITRDNAYRLIQWNAARVPGEDLILATGRDISDRSTYEAALVSSEARLANIVNMAIDAILSIDAGQNIIFFNPAAEKIFGYTAREIVGQPLARLLPERFVEQHTGHVAEFAGSTASERVMGQLRELWGRRKDGSEFPIEAAIGKSLESGQTVLTVMLRDITERRNALEALQISEERFRSLAQHAPVGIFQTDERGRCVYVNEHWSHLAGLSRAEAMGEGWVGALHPDDRERVFREWQSAADEGREFSAEYRFQTPAGKVNWVFGRALGLIGPDGNITGYLGTVTDITERRQAEEERDRFFTLSLDMLAIANFGGYFTRLNPAWERALGYTREELMAEPFLSFVHPDDQAATAAEAQTLAEGGRTISFENRYRCRDGTYRWLLWSAVAYQDQQLIYAAARDVTERKQAEQALREAEVRMRAIVGAMPVPVLITRVADGQILFANEQFGQTHGVPVEDVIGRPAPDLYADPSERQVLLDQLKRDGFVSNYEMQGRRLSTGELFWSAVWIQPLTYGGAPAMLGAFHDITRQKQAAEELRRAKEAADAANRAKSVFLANMSHEIRTPMNAIIGMTGLLLDTELSAEQLEFADTIRGSADALLALINDILDFSKIESGHLELEQQPFDLRDCIESALDLLSSRAAEKKLELAYLIGDNTPATLVGDVNRLRQILVNLLSNAVKFTDRGEVVVDVKGQPVGGAPNQHRLHFSVSDTGLGVPAERMDRLFKMFSQVDTSTTRQYGGTGLGLAICRRLAELMGGEIWVESEGLPGRGSTFHFTIQVETAPEQRRLYLPSIRAHLADKRLLIVDDNATNRRILSLQAESWGMQPRAAASGPEALEWLGRGDPFDIAILDMHMPDMDGLEVAQRMRHLPAGRQLPLILLTSIGHQAEPPAGVEFAAVLSKPIKASPLHDALTKILGGLAATEPGPAPTVEIDTQLGARHPLRILVAEDHLVNQKVAIRILNRLGYRPDVAAHGLEVLESLRRQTYDVILMDVHMPEMDGLEATRRIVREWPANRRPRIVAMTANALEGDRERCLEAGMDDYVSKPVRIDELVSALNKCQPLPAGEAAALGAHTALGPIDAEALREFQATLGEDDPDLLAELIDTYLVESKVLLEEMRAGVAAGVAQTVLHTAHTLKSSSQMFGAVTLADLCRELEIASQANQLAGAAAQQARIEAEYARVSQALAAIRDTAARNTND